MTAQPLAGTFTSGNLPRQLFDTERLLEELHHPHPVRRAAAYEAAGRLLGLAADRVTFWEGTRTEVWSHIFDGDRLQADIDGGSRKRRPRDPMRAVGALLVVEALARVVALRSGIECAIGPEIELRSDGEIASVIDRLQTWIGGACPSSKAA